MEILLSYWIDTLWTFLRCLA